MLSPKPEELIPKYVKFKEILIRLIGLISKPNSSENGPNYSDH